METDVNEKTPLTTEELLLQFPRQRAATTRASKHERYVIDAMVDVNGPTVFLGSTYGNHSSSVKPSSVTLLPFFIGEDRGTLNRISLDPAHDCYRTAAELAALIPAREAEAETVTHLAAAGIEFVRSSGGTVTVPELTEYLVGVDPERGALASYQAQYGGSLDLNHSRRPSTVSLRV